MRPILVNILLDSAIRYCPNGLSVGLCKRTVGQETYAKEIKSLFKVFFFIGLEGSHPCFEFGLDGSSINGSDGDARS
jgi:hypothetical protein